MAAAAAADVLRQKSTAVKKGSNHTSKMIHEDNKSDDSDKGNMLNDLDDDGYSHDFGDKEEEKIDESE